MLRPIWTATLVLLVAAGCSHAPQSNTGGHEGMPGRVTGHVFYRERVALPTTAVITVTLADVSRMDSQAEVVATQEIIAEGKQVPIAFALAFEPGKINPAGAYAVSARISDGDKLLWISPAHTKVLTRGAPATAELLVMQVAAQ